MYTYTFEHNYTKALHTVTADNAYQAMKENNLKCNLWTLVDKVKNF